MWHKLIRQTSIGDAIFYLFHLATSVIASALRFGAGAPAAPANVGATPVLYEFEGCPFCRIAREAVSEAGVAVLVRPCPKGGKRFRPEVVELGGKAQFPYLIDPNTDKKMYESADIARYLVKTYGGARPFIQWTGPVNLVSSQFAMLARLLAGTFRIRSRAPEKPLEFFGAERDPRARLVKERLCAMEIEYLWRPVRGAPRLNDPNTGASVAGAEGIRRYLKETYRP